MKGSNIGIHVDTWCILQIIILSSCCSNHIMNWNINHTVFWCKICIRELVDVGAAFPEGKLKINLYLNSLKGMVELGSMSQGEYENSCSELTGGVYGCCVNAALLYFVRFFEYALIPKGLSLTQRKVDPCVFFRESEKGEH